MTSTNWCMYYKCFCDEVEDIMYGADVVCHMDCKECSCRVNCDKYENED